MPCLKILAPLLLVSLIVACDHKQTSITADDTTAVAPPKAAEKPTGPIHTDTLQFIHFEGNFDYWSGVFIDARKDTVQLVTDNQIPDKFKNRLVAVTWFTDTLTEAGDNDSKYAAKRLKNIRPINGKLFSSPISEATIVKDIENLPEVQGNADQTGIAERPKADKEYYLVETGTHNEDNFSRLFMFRVYVYPKYEIKYYDPAADTELSLEEWRKQKQ